MQIRAYKESDKESLVEIWYQASLQAHYFLSEDTLVLQKEEVRTIYLPMAETWVAEEHGQIVGFISLIGNYIGGLFILPAAQGKHMGTALIQYTYKLKGLLTVGVYKKNEKARKFYTRCGFTFHAEQLQPETGELVMDMYIV